MAARRMNPRALLALAAEPDGVVRLRAMEALERPSRRDLRAVAERLELQNLDAVARQLRELAAEWHPDRNGGAPAPRKHTVKLYSVVRDANDAGYFVRVPVDVMWGALPGDRVKVRFGDDVIVISRADGA